jgi:hypothetical protein
MAASYCLAILAGFCFHSPTINAQVSDFRLGYAVTVTTPDYQAETGQTDNIRFHDWRNEPKACADANCVRYRRTCADYGEKSFCRYNIAITGRVGDGYIDMTAPNPAGIAKAEAEVSLWFASDNAMLSLSALNSSTQGGPLPPCPSDLDPKLCNPP